MVKAIVNLGVSESKFRSRTLILASAEFAYRKEMNLLSTNQAFLYFLLWSYFVVVCFVVVHV